MSDRYASIAEVWLWGRSIGAVSWDAEESVAYFEYDPDFRHSGIQLAPFTMPLGDGIHAFPGLSRESFKGLPGLLVDSLPDDFGNALIDAWLARQGRRADSFNPVERLCYTGRRGMGALEYRPARGPAASKSEAVDIEALVALASDILRQRSRVDGSFELGSRESVLNDILRIGTSAGGARAKAVIAWNPVSNEVRSGQLEAGSGFDYWILKFDGVSANRDRELEDPQGYGLIEYAYYLLAREAGIDISESRLLHENGRSHFMTKRFDRHSGGMKLHMQSLAALEHFDYRRPGAYSYEQAFQTIRKLDLPMASIEEQFRRMVFNVIARNQDDHVKNISFLMDTRGEWSLSPAYDLTYSYNPTGDWTGKHQMSLNGKRDDFSMQDFIACARTCAMKRGRAEEIVSEVGEALRQWPGQAEDLGIPGDIIDRITRTQRLDLVS